jgi:alkylation response protein AidB-like acyl-CoA dehydrogenase
MDFRFDPDEREIVAQAGLTLQRHLPATRLLENESARPRWDAVAQDGWLHAGLDEASGGSDLSLALVAAVGREAGRVLAGDGYVTNAIILPGLLASLDEPESVASLLAHPGFLLADGRAEELVADLEAPVPWCAGVEHGLNAYALTDDGLLVRYGPDAWTFEPLAGLGLTTGAVRIAANAVPEWSARVVTPDSEVLEAAQVVHAGTLVGLGEAALADTVEYVQQREQFGGPIGRFQAVKHGLAEVAVKLEVAWNAVLYAALQRDEASVWIARMQAAEATDAAVRAMVQFFGGIAMTWEHHAHLFVKTAQATRWRFGATDAYALRLAAGLSREQVAQ